MKMENKDEDKRVYVTTDCDMWNSADSAHFYVTKGQVKPLPDDLTPIIEDALEQKLLREATQSEMDSYNKSIEMEKLVRTGVIKAGKDTKETEENYYTHIQVIKSVEVPEVKVEKEIPVSEQDESKPKGQSYHEKEAEKKKLEAEKKKKEEEDKDKKGNKK